MEQPPWLAAAWAELGQREIAGSTDNARIVAMYRDARHPEITHDEIAWCAAFVGACLACSGSMATGSLMARSYLSWGTPLDEGRLGALAVLSRGSDPSLGHVGFLIGENDQSLYLLGGNQSDAVSVQGFPRSRLIGLRWPPEPAAPRIPPDIFETALAHVLKMEGGYTNDPADPGGPTNRGITLVDLAAARGMMLGSNTRDTLLRDLKAILEAEVRRIYLEQYWRPCLAEELPAPLAVMHFDCAVNQGVAASARMLQEALDVAADGEIGPLTLAAAANADPARTLSRYAEIRRRRYRSLSSFTRFGRGWLNRVDATLRLARALVPSPSQPKGSPAMSDANPAASETASAPPSSASSPTGNADALPKWWGGSMTVWGTLITAAATVLPAFGPLIGIEISAGTVRQVGNQTVEVIQGIAGLLGTLMALYGRTRASQPLVRRELTVKL